MRVMLDMSPSLKMAITAPLILLFTVQINSHVVKSIDVL